jgi:indole-3-glycerol phosphate synthase
LVSDFLTEMAETSLLRARAAKEGAGVTGLESRAASAPPASPITFGSEGFDVIAEAKLASPSEGRITEGGVERVVELAGDYEAGGAVAISILTEETRFLGSLDHLEAAAASSSVPVMRKDFLVDPVQILEARAAGASGVLLISRLLPGELLVEMTDLTLDLGMFALIEVFDRSDLETSVRVFDRDVLVGVNCRDLASLEVDFGRLAELAPHLPDHLPAVAESGMTEPGHAAEVAASGYRLALIGSSLASAEKPDLELAAFLASGRNRIEGP